MVSSVQFGKVARDSKQSNVDKLWRAVTRPGNEPVSVTLSSSRLTSLKDHSDGSVTLAFSASFDEIRQVRELEVAGLARLNSLVGVSDEVSALLDDGDDMEEHLRSRVLADSIVFERQPPLFSKEDVGHLFDVEVRVDGIGTSKFKSLTLVCTILSRVAKEEEEEVDVPIPDPEVVEQIRSEMRTDIQDFLERQAISNKKALVLLAQIDDSPDFFALDRLREDFESIA